jgi:pimeloyl-ACP methyl ester carboxylesterase
MTRTNTLELPGVRMSYQLRGSGTPLLLIGMPLSPSVMRPLADALAGDHTVLTHDARSISGGTLGDLEPDATPRRRADDVAALLDVLDLEPADVFGTGEGAVIGLALVTQHPGRVRTLIAHEPPLLELLPEAAARRVEIDDIVETVHRDGPEVAWEKFVGSATFHAGEGGLESAFRYVPDLSAMTASGSRIVVGIGAASRNLTIHRTSMALAKLLGTRPVTFPGDQCGFVGQAQHFAEMLRTMLAGEQVRRLHANPRHPAAARRSRPVAL